MGGTCRLAGLLTCAQEIYRPHSALGQAGSPGVGTACDADHSALGVCCMLHHRHFRHIAAYLLAARRLSLRLDDLVDCVHRLAGYSMRMRHCLPQMPLLLTGSHVYLM